MISLTPILQVASDTHAEDISSNLTSCQAATTAISEDLEVVRGGLNQGPEWLKKTTVLLFLNAAKQVALQYILQYIFVTCFFQSVQ